MIAMLAAAFLFLKTGEKFATQEAAGPTVAGLTGYLGEKLSGSTNEFAPRVLNDPAKAAEFASASKPALAIVTPGFFLTYAKALKMEPLLETRRENINAERYVLVAKKGAGDLNGKTIATSLAAEQRYVIAVVLQNKFGEEARLAPITDVEGAVIDLAEGAKNAPDAVLVEEAAWKLFEADPDLGSKLAVAFRSDELPRDLVVSISGGVNAEKVKSILKAMSGTDAGKQILKSIRVESFVDVNAERLSKAQALFHAK